MLVSDLEASYPIARWLDHWKDCWEYKKGGVYESSMQADWLSQKSRGHG
jgi:hypothetical protein